MNQLPMNKFTRGLIYMLIGTLFFAPGSLCAQFDYPYDFTYNGNPLVRNHGAADPDAHVWDDTVWMYCSQDHAPAYEAMDGYHAFSSVDMIHWTDHGEILHSRDISWGPPGWMWAPGAARKDGIYYLYYPHKDHSGQWRIGIATSDVPQGPFTDIGAPMEGIGGIDPAIFIDDDGAAYIYNNCAIVAKLKPNMLELAESPRKINYDVSNSITDQYLEGFAEGSYMHKKDGIYYYSYSNWHNKIYQSFYATGDNPYGPFEWQGPLAPKPQGAQDHHSIIEFGSQWYYFYHIAVGEHPIDKDGQGRIACYDRLYYNDDGTIQLVIQTYGPTNLLTLNATDGKVVFDPPGRSYAPGTNVTLTAIGDLGYGFASWDGDLSGTDNPATIVMDSDREVTANFVTVPTYELTVGVPNGTFTLDPPGGIYNEGTVVHIQASADFGYTFSKWTGDLSGTDNPATLTMDADKTVEAVLIPREGPALVFATNCGGDAFKSSEGIVYTADHSYSGGGTFSNNNAISGTTDDILYQSERIGNFSYQIDLPADSYDVILMFAEIFWSQSGKRVFNISMEGVEVTSNLDIFAEVGKNAPYEELYRVQVADGVLNIAFSNVVDNAKVSAIRILTPAANFELVTHAENGTITPDPPGGNYDSATVVTLTAIADTGYRFNGWSGDLTGSTNPYSIVMDTDKSVTALFEEIPTYTLTTNINNGSILLDPPGGIYEGGTVVTLTVVPDEGFDFIGWSGDLSWAYNPTTLYMDEDKTVTAVTYGNSQFSLSVNAENGTVTFDPEGGTYAQGTSVTLTAAPDEGYVFTHWQGDLSGTANPETITVNGDMEVTAIFTEITHINGLLHDRPGQSYLGQNVPNPFRYHTTIPYQLDKASCVKLSIYNSLGQQLAVLVDAQQPAGSHKVLWQPGDRGAPTLSNGVYFIRLETQEGGVCVLKSIFLN